MDFTLYWFMFPIAILISMVAMMSGIAGAALFMPVFLLVFPMLGAMYVLGDPVVSIAAALITSSFGFASGFIGYYRKGLIDFQQAIAFIKIAVPLAIIGAVLSAMVAPVWIRLAYGLLMLVLTFVLFRPTKERGTNDSSFQKTDAQHLTASDGTVYTYRSYSINYWITGIGGFLTGLLSSGVGEVVMPQLVKKGRFPIPVAAATSVLVVISTFAFAAITHSILLIKNGGLNAIPWNLVCYTIPGVIIGGQLGPRFQGRIARVLMVRAIALVFFIIALTMLATVYRDLY